MGKREAKWEDAVGIMALLTTMAKPMEELCEAAVHEAMHDMRQHGFSDLQTFAAWLRADGHQATFVMAAHTYLEAKATAERQAEALGVGA